MAHSDDNEASSSSTSSTNCHDIPDHSLSMDRSHVTTELDTEIPEQAATALSEMQQEVDLTMPVYAPTQLPGSPNAAGAVAGGGKITMDSEKGNERDHIDESISLNDTIVRNETEEGESESMPSPALNHTYQAAPTRGVRFASVIAEAENAPEFSDSSSEEDAGEITVLQSIPSNQYSQRSRHSPTTTPYPAEERVITSSAVVATGHDVALGEVASVRLIPC